jgi:hypothetical protein
LNRLRYFILSAADDYGGVGLWELSGVRFIEDVGGKMISQDPTPRSEVQPVLEQLIRDGHLEMCDSKDPDRCFSSADALDIVADDGNWAWPAHHCYWLELTVSGVEECRKGFNALWGQVRRG